MHTENGLLLERAARGDTEAFSQLIINYEKLIYNVAYRLLGNPDDALDAVQQSLLKIYGNIHKCTDIRTFKSWICTITNNTCIDELRKRKGRREESLNKIVETEDGVVALQFDSKEPTPEDVILMKEKNRIIQKAINGLPYKYKLLITLRDINGLSYEELAKITGLTMGTVKSRLSRARERLQRDLDGKI